MSAEIAALWHFLTKEWPRHTGGYVARGVKSPLLPGRWIFSGVLLLALIGYLCYLSFSFDSASQTENQPIVSFVLTMIGAGLIFFYMVELCRYARPGINILLWIAFVGVVMRLLMLFSVPILEVDFYRYQWDGAVTANGLNPYRYSPQDIATGAVDDSAYREIYERLMKDSDGVVDRINHGYLRTIYPVMTQLGFAGAYWLSPWKLIGWRSILLLFDLLTATLILMLLWKLGCSPVWVAVYWLNPLVVKEILNSGHMDALLFPFLLAAILAQICQKRFWVMIFLALATAVKVWPVLLLPIFLRQYWPNWRKILSHGTVFGGLALLFFLPIFLAGFSSDSGFSAYLQRWQLNDSIFRLLLWSAEGLLPLLKIHPGYGQSVARVISTVSIIGAVLFYSWKKSENQKEFIVRLMWPVAALFFLSPTQFPWYAVWLMPFLALVPRHSLILLTILMPLYYLRYWFEAQDNVQFFDHYVVWLQYLPVWWFLWREKQLGRRIDNRLTPRRVFD